MFDVTDIKEEEEPVIYSLGITTCRRRGTEKILSNTTNKTAGEITVGKMSIAEEKDTIISVQQLQSVPPQQLRNRC